MRKLAIAVIVLLSLLAGATYVSFAAPATGCNFPSSLDNFEAVQPRDRLFAATWTRVVCAVNALEVAVNGLSNEVEKSCTSVLVAAGERRTVNVSLSGGPYAGTEAAFASVKDTTSPSRVTMDGIQALNSSSMDIWVFNHSATSDRTVTVCAMVTP